MEKAFASLSLAEKPPRGVNLHPQNFTPSSFQERDFDVIVIGSGPVGRALAARTAAEGLKTVCIENELYGGDCPFWACIPSKALLRPAEAIESARQLSGAKELIDGKSVVDVQATFTRRDNFVQRARVSIYYAARASLAGEKKVLVENVNGERVELTANHAVVLATGSEPIRPPIDGLDDVDFWTSRDATSANEVPKHLIVVGGGVVGCEMATAYATYGAKVTLICSGKVVLDRYEPEASKRVAAALKARGTDVHVSTRVKAVKKSAEGVEVTLDSGKTVSGSKILIAAGRRPRLSNIGLEKVGTKPAAFAVEDNMTVKSVSGQWLYAIGDANFLAPLTHMGVYQARYAALNILERAKGKGQVDTEPWGNYSATAHHKAISQVVMTDPNVATVGLTFAEAKTGGKNVKEVTVPAFMYPGAWVHAEFNYDGWAQWVVDVDKKTIVGATFVGREAADLLHASTVALVGEVPIDRLWHAVPSFPTMSEIYQQLLLASEKVLKG